MQRILTNDKCLVAKFEKFFIQPKSVKGLIKCWLMTLKFQPTRPNPMNDLQTLIHPFMRSKSRFSTSKKLNETKKSVFHHSLPLTRMREKCEQNTNNTGIQVTNFLERNKERSDYSLFTKPIWTNLTSNLPNEKKAGGWGSLLKGGH